MKKNFYCGLVFGVLVLGTALVASATTITTEKTGSPLALAHGEVYVWGVSSDTWNSLTNPITSASITLTNIWDDNTYGYNDDQLALYLFDEAFMNSTQATWLFKKDDAVIDPTGRATNSFEKLDANRNLFLAIRPLVTYLVPEDINNSKVQKVTLTYDFTADDLSVLQAYLGTSTAGNNAAQYRDIAIGLDPDCHFKLDKITFTVSDDVAPVPEPATMLLFGTGIAGLAGIVRRKRD